MCSIVTNIGVSIIGLSIYTNSVKTLILANYNFMSVGVTPAIIVR